jgi:Cu(I)/Ag(I) efflux system membrane protein CusA/SilA
MTETEYMVRGLGYVESINDIKNIAVGVSKNGTPIFIKDIANVYLGPDIRRGIAERDGKGEVVGGIVVMRFGENALKVIENVKKKIKEIEPGLPKGVRIIPNYDRSRLIHRAIHTLKEKILEECLIVGLVCILFLWHFRSALVAILTLPLGILISFIIMYYQGINANIMSLGGIAIAIGAMIDAAIVMVENAHKMIEAEGERKDRWKIVVEASKQVGPALFFSLLIITISFLPVFTLQAQEGRLFSPLAFTKTYAMAGAALVSVTLVPILMGYFIRGKITPEQKNPLNRLLLWIYKPIVHLVLRYKKTTILVAILIVLATIYPLKRLGHEFMPPLNEGDILYMPTTLPGISITEAKKILQTTDKIFRTFPEVDIVFGKIGRADTATDPAPLTMIETTVTLKDKKYWRKGMTIEKLMEEMDKNMQIPGLTNAWTMPIKTRIDMLSTGIKTPVGIKVFGSDLKVIEDIAIKIENVVKKVPGCLSAYAERVMGGNYLDFEIDRREIARYGLTIGDVQDVIATAIGGMNITTTVEGRERFPINVRYGRELRDNIEALKRVLIPTPTGAQIPLGQLAEFKIKKGPAGIKSENAMLCGIVYVDIRGRDVGGFVEEAREVVAKEVEFPPGYYISWSGQYEYMERANKRLKMIIPITLIVVFLLLYFNFRNITEPLIIMLSLPFAVVGGIWMMYLFGFNMSIAVGVGFIALAGVAAETGVVMLIYLDLAYKKRLESGEKMTIPMLYEAIIEGAVMRIRPKIMTVLCIMGGLLPLFWGAGAGSRVMMRIATPMIGGMISSTILTLIVIPAIYALVKGINIRREERRRRKVDI